MVQRCRKGIAVILVIMLVVWVVCSLNEVYTHNEATFYGYSHEYSSWNIFILLFDNRSVLP